MVFTWIWESFLFKKKKWISILLRGIAFSFGSFYKFNIWTETLYIFVVVQFDVTFPALACSLLSVDAMDISGEQHYDIVCLLRFDLLVEFINNA